MVNYKELASVFNLDYRAKTLYIYTGSEAEMEQWVRVQNERDRQVLAWLRGHIGDDAIIKAAGQCRGVTGKPYLSAVCREMGIMPPSSAFVVFQPGKVGEQHLADIYQILQRPKSSLPSKPGMHSR